MESGGGGRKQRNEIEFLIKSLFNNINNLLDRYKNKKNMKTAIASYKLKIESPIDIIIHKINKIILGKKIADEKKWSNHTHKFRKKYFKNGLWNFNGIKLPDYKSGTMDWLIYTIYLDTLFVYCVHNDDYNYKLVGELDKILPEGTYCYKNDNFDVTVKEDDVVIDAGAWIGDFSAYASIKGAKVYAFEPSKDTVEYLKKTKELNNNIQILEKGLGDKSGSFSLSNNQGNTGANQITEQIDNSEKIEVTTIDEFVVENNLERIDFIKADIEGFERYMLMGAKETLRRFSPKLAICTYHLPDDPEMLSRIILDANPNYTIIQKRKKLYAMVEK